MRQVTLLMTLVMVNSDEVDSIGIDNRAMLKNSNYDIVGGIYLVFGQVNGTLVAIVNVYVEIMDYISVSQKDFVGYYAN